MLFHRKLLNFSRLIFNYIFKLLVRLKLYFKPNYLDFKRMFLDEKAMRSLARRLLVWSALVLSLLVIGRLLFGRDFRLPTTTIALHDDGDVSIPMILDSSHVNLQQDDSSPGPSAYVAGTYMTGRRPRNESACKWYYGLPDVLSYSLSRLAGTPEIGEKSLYR